MTHLVVNMLHYSVKCSHRPLFPFPIRSLEFSVRFRKNVMILPVVMRAFRLFWSVKTGFLSYSRSASNSLVSIWSFSFCLAFLIFHIAFVNLQKFIHCIEVREQKSRVFIKRFTQISVRCMNVLSVLDQMWMSVARMNGRYRSLKRIFPLLRYMCLSWKRGYHVKLPKICRKISEDVIFCATLPHHF